jgi:potassium channel subfamily K
LKECIVAILSYSGLGVLAYTVLVEKWSIIDALYFSVVTFTTVGYGDVCPSTWASKLFTMVFGLLGISMLGTAIGTIGSNLVQAETKVLEAAENASRKRVLEFFDTVVATSSIQLMSEREEGSPISEDGKVAPVGWKQAVLKLVNKFIPAFSLLVAGGIWMGRLEGWSWFDSLYYSIITAGTLGYGDFSPKTSSGRAWGIIFIPLAVAAAGDVLGSVASTLLERRQNRLYQSIAERELNVEQLLKMDTSKNGKVSREEYVQFMLREMQLVDDEQFAELHAQFARLDVDGSGSLDQEDLRLLAERKKQNAGS